MPDRVKEEALQLLSGRCLELFLGGYQSEMTVLGVFVVATDNKTFSCEYATSATEGRVGDTVYQGHRIEAIALQRCEKSKQKNGVDAPCRVFARRYEIVWRKTIERGLELNPFSVSN